LKDRNAGKSLIYISVGEIKKQGIKNTIITYIGIAIGFISLIFIQPHLLEPSELGLIRVLMAFSGLIASLFLLGVSNVNIRYFPYFKNKEQKHHGYFGLMLLFPLVGCIIGAFLIFLSKDFIISQYVKESKLFADYFLLLQSMSSQPDLCTSACAFAREW